MKRVLFSIQLILSLLFLPCIANAQLERIIVEKYYVSDEIDSTDVFGGGLDSGSVTYRIYVDMKPGSKLVGLFGDANHTFKIKSTEIFFNNADGNRGVTFPKDMSTSYLGEHTAALDTWITIGQVAKTPGKQGILKNQDTDGSLIGGVNNDGGSAGVSGGLLTNADPTAGLPLTTSDGMIAMSTAPGSFLHSGIIHPGSGNDSTIFGSNKQDSVFISNDVSVISSGVSGPNVDTNQVIIAQLTTKGELSFELNLTIKDAEGNTINYVADDSILLPGEKLSRYLKYPFQLLCGCLNPEYLEYDEDRDYQCVDSCKNVIVFGCMDPQACNYDPNANYSVPFLCCYPGYCNDRDLTVVCPQVSNQLSVDIYPNPAQNDLTIEISNSTNETVIYKIYDSFGTIVLEKNLGNQSDYFIDQTDISTFNVGLYLVRVERGSLYETKLFMKN